VAGTMFLQPDDGRLVRLQGQLAKSPSFWIKKSRSSGRMSASRGRWCPWRLHRRRSSDFSVSPPFA
jgi:hypothetical protein